MNIAGSTSPVINWYFMSAMTLILTVVLTFVTEKVLAKLVDDTKIEMKEHEKSQYELTQDEKKDYFILELL